MANKVRVYEYSIGIPSVAIIQLSDLHFEETYKKFSIPLQCECIAKIIDLIAISPKKVAVLVTGDVVDYVLDITTDSSIKLFFETLIETIEGRRLKSKFLGVYFVPGNHDYIDDFSKYKNLINSLPGCKLLADDDVVLHLGRPGEKTVRLYGDHDISRKGKEKDFEGIIQFLLNYPDDYLILAAHNPSVFEHPIHKYYYCMFHLALSGHTHGAQVCFPELMIQLPQWLRNMFTDYRGHHCRFQAGKYKPYSYSDTKLVVSPGLGTHIPGRFFQPPSINYLK